mmetsp:Transcript_7888/g.10304  ORF Transcript_7888/g.10304 Transcript_7888/m.10304 type:complete len:375 (-) Transcript_7888:822-1946(-)
MKRITRSAALRARQLMEEKSAGVKRKRVSRPTVSSRSFASLGIETVEEGKRKNGRKVTLSTKLENRATLGPGKQHKSVTKTERVPKISPAKPTVSRKANMSRKSLLALKQESSSPIGNKQAGREKSARKTRVKDYSHKPPKDWERNFELMYLLRAHRNAPVDSMGAEALPQKCHGKKVFRYQVLISLMLSSQTKDQMVSKAMKRLQNHGLTVENINNTNEDTLRELIYGVGFHNRKTEYIKKATAILLQKYEGDIPNNAEEMVRELPGVGPKMAFLTLNIAFDKPAGIGVDTHVLRFCKILGWSNSTNAEIARKQLESWLPQSKWIDINLIMVGLGQHIQQKDERKKLSARLEELSEAEKKASIKLLKKLGFKA